MTAQKAGGLADLIADFAIGIGDQEVPAAVITAAHRSILDTLAVSVAGGVTPTAAAARRALLPIGRSGPATVLGTRESAAPSVAAMLNGVAAHALDFDDVWADDDGVVAWRGHPSVCVLPAVLAAAEARPAAGIDVLTGYVAGTEVAGKLGTAFGPALGRAGWHPTAILGTIGAAVGAARVLGLSRSETAIALGLAATQSSGLHRNFGTDTKPFHAGHAARCGLDAAMLAGDSFTANPAAIIDYVAVHGGDPSRSDRVLRALGVDYDLVYPGLSIKKYPCCRFAHLPLDALFGLLSERSVETATVEEIVVRIQPGADDALVCPYAVNGLEGKFSMAYVLAAGLYDRHLTLDSFTDEKVLRPAVRALMGRVRTEYWGEKGAQVELSTVSRSWHCRAEVVRGDPSNPLSDREAVDKCRYCLEGVLPTGREVALAGAVTRLAWLPTASELTQLLTPEPRLATPTEG